MVSNIKEYVDMKWLKAFCGS